MDEKVLLVSPPNPFLENPKSVPKLGLLYLATALKGKCYDVKVVHLQDLNEIQHLLDYDYVCISSTTREYPDALKILNYYKRMNSKAAVLIGGPHANALPNECLTNGFDVVVTGEADKAIPHILNYYPKGIVECGEIDNLDLIPFPDRTLLSDNWNPYLKFGGQRTASILLSRGCMFKCGFCGPHASYRRRSDRNIRTELRVLEVFGYRGIIVLDDLPFVNKLQVKAFCDSTRMLGMKFRCNFRYESITEEIAKYLVISGCTRIQIGVESVTQEVLDAVDKKSKSYLSGEAVAICRDNGLPVKAMFIWGLPGDSEKSAVAIIDWVRKYKPESIQVSAFVPLPGSPMWNAGFNRDVIDYDKMSFFGSGMLGVATKEINDLRLWIIEECSKYTNIDRGLANDSRNTLLKQERTNERRLQAVQPMQA